ncbi:MAG: SusC/RagA family TonB-linked outer membrane protein, partial [Lutibacter sp.]|nr:SusC/RagA family TonB-linked outer membrane protein [Lutibacter sp.]
MKNFKIFLFNVMLILPLVTFAQQTVKGKVTEAAGGTALPGVGVIIKGTTKGAATDFDGNYTLENVKPADVLVFSYVGFNTQSVTVGNNTTINIILTESAESLDEVVIIGYGTTTVKDATGSVAAVTAKDFNKGNIVTPASLIQGRVAGVDIVSDGAPGGGSTIRIRGGSSLGASNDPLIVIDGLPISNSTVGGSTSILSSINPNDIESFSILKDASATAIYGSRASNGVIIITTKKGKQDFQVNVNLKTGYQTLADKISVFSADDYRNLIADRVEAGQTGISVAQLGNANTDWQDEIYREDFTSDNSISLSGAVLKNLPARLSIGNTQQPGLRKTSKFERTSLTLNLNPRFFNESLKVNFNLNASAEKNRFADGVEGAALYFDPTQPVYDPTSPFGGFFEYHTNGEPNNAPRNPVASLMQRKNTSVVDRLFGNVEFDYKFLFLPELRAVVNLGYDRSNGIGSNKLSDQSINGYRPKINTPFLGSFSEYTSERKNTLLDAYLAYNKKSENVNIEVTGGYSYQKFEGEDFNSGNTIDPTSESDVNTHPDVVLIGFFGRTNLSFMDKYLLTLSYRRDGTSRFSEANRWGNFPAAALAWKINEEDFLKDSNTLSTLKLRLGWGITGQQDIPASYAYLGRHLTGDAVSQYIFGNTAIVVGIPQSRFEAIKWEETTTYNAGLDFGFANDRITGSAEVYLKESKDLLANVAVADGSNFSNAGWQNIGKFTSKGIEFTLGADVVKTENFKWNANYNLNLNQTKIDELALGQDLEVGGIAGGTGSRIQVHS